MDHYNYTEKKQFKQVSFLFLSNSDNNILKLQVLCTNFAIQRKHTHERGLQKKVLASFLANVLSYKYPVYDKIVTHISAGKQLVL